MTHKQGETDQGVSDNALPLLCGPCGSIDPPGNLPDTVPHAQSYRGEIQHRSMQHGGTTGQSVRAHRQDQRQIRIPKKQTLKNASYHPPKNRYTNHIPAWIPYAWRLYKVRNGIMSQMGYSQKQARTFDKEKNIQSPAIKRDRMVRSVDDVMMGLRFDGDQTVIMKEYGPYDTNHTVNQNIDQIMDIKIKIWIKPIFNLHARHSRMWS